MIKVSVSRRSERFAPQGGTEVQDYSDLETAIKEICEITESDVKVSIASDNSNIVGLDVDFDLEIQDVDYDDEGNEIEGKVFTSVEDGRKYRLHKGRYEEVKNQ